MYRWFGAASRQARQAFASKSRFPNCGIFFPSTSAWIYHNGSTSISMHSLLPILSIPQMQFSTRGRPGRSPNKGGGGFDDDDDGYDDDEEDDEDDVEDGDDEEQNYKWDYDTWNILHAGKKEGEKSRRRPLPMYKAREMIDFHMLKNRPDAIQILSDPALEAEIRKSLHEGLVDFYTKTRAVFDEIDAEKDKEKDKEKEKLESMEDNEALKVLGNEGETQEAGEELKIEGETSGLEGPPTGEEESVEGNIGGTGMDAAEVMSAQDHVIGVDALSDSSEVQRDTEGETLTAGGDPATVGEAYKEEEKVVAEESSVVEGGLASLETERHTTETENEEASDGGINVFNYEKWDAFRKEEISKEMARRAEEQKGPTLRWRTQLVLGPGDAWHPANRKVRVSVYVKELGLSKHAKSRLIALVGKRYNTPKDELTIVSERYQHRYENQKDVLRTLLDLIEEAKKADKLVDDARMEFVKAKQSAADSLLQATRNEAAVLQPPT